MSSKTRLEGYVTEELVRIPAEITEKLPDLMTPVATMPHWRNISKVSLWKSAVPVVP